MKEINVTFQEPLFARAVNFSYNRYIMGLFFEHLTAAIFTGKVNSQTSQSYDVRRGLKIYESKALRTGHHLLIRESQLNLYQQHKGDCEWVIFRHRFKGISSSPLGPAEIWKELTQLIAEAVIIPFPIVELLYRDGKKYDRFRSGGNSSGLTATVASSVLRALFEGGRVRPINKKLVVNGTTVKPFPMQRVQQYSISPF